MQLLPSLLSGLTSVCATFPDPRKGRGGNIAIADFGVSALAMFFMQSASFLAYQHAGERPGPLQLQGIGRIPSDNYIRDILDEADPSCCSPVSDAWKRCWPSRRCGRPSAGWAEGP
jgi:hypothetical protein